ncbi:hypothetical protein NXY31_26280 [Bacteroides salyersiae]|nr:hypothetical protein [Bacteroides salyersiae]
MDNMDKRIQRYFQDELSSVERLNLLREIEKDENLKKQFIETQNMRALLSLSPQEEDMHESIRKYKMFIKRIGRVRNIQVMTAMLKYAAVILLVIASTYWLMEWKTTSERQEWMAKKATMYVPAGQRPYSFRRWKYGVAECSVKADLFSIFCKLGKTGYS